MSVPQVAEIDDTVLLANYAYKDEALSMPASSKSRIQSLIKHMDQLKKDPIPGIFVRHGGSRLDVMKIMIAGPQGTPYESGLFEFDLFCDHNFPQEPPKTRLRNTASGTVMFNPNLYKNGKVCFSLLGTWGDGLAWNEICDTTLHQVLLSIQAFVFVVEPYLNEPDTNEKPGSSLTTAYNRFIYHLTMKHAMIDWLEGNVYQSTLQRMNGEALSAPEYYIWNDVINAHFASEKEQILVIMDRWLQSSPIVTGNSQNQSLELATRLKDAAGVMGREEWQVFHEAF